MSNRKPLWVRFVSWIMTIIATIVIILGIALGVIYFKYGINVFETFKQVRILNEEIKLKELAPNTFSIEDMQSAKDITDINCAGLITYTEDTGYNFAPSEFTGIMTGELKFTDKQIGAILNTMIDDQNDLTIKIGEEANLKDYGFEVVQVAFDNITDTTTDFNVIVKIELTKVKASMKDFPLNLIKKWIPEKIYISSTATITKGENAFEYTTKGKDLKINNLNSKETASMLKTINTFLTLGTANDFAKLVADIFINGLIGDEENSGLAYELKDIGARDFAFETDETNNYYIVKM